MKTKTINGVRLAFVDQGSGTPILLVHGFPLDHSMWNAQIEALARDYRVIAVDLRGFGQSQAGDEKVTMEQYADDLAGLLDALAIEDQVVFAGLSMGGYVAWQFWRKYPSRVKGLILCDTRAVADTPEMAAGRLEMAERILDQGPLPLVEIMIPKLFAQSTVENRPDVVETLRGVMLSTDRRAVAAAARGMAQRPDVTPMLGEIDCPSLVIVGQHDAISTAEEMRSIADAIPQASYVEIADSGHMTTIEKPAEVNAAMLDFVGKL
jgi:3-oxoadipate enol-lactonase